MRIAVVALIGILLAGVLYFTPRLAPATAKTYTLVLKDDVLASGPSLMTVNQGDAVTLHVQSDREGHLMIHGYEKELTDHEKELAIGAGGETSLTFVADKSGRYMVHLHTEDRHIEIAQIDVQPR
jgi:plastocyanin